MKIRHGFVSNSSSSSFIIDHDSNKYLQFFHANDMKRLTLHDYLQQFGWREFAEKVWWKSQPEVDFVSDKSFASLFPESFSFVLPYSAKNDWKKHQDLEKRQAEIYNSEVINSAIQQPELDKIRKALDKTEHSILQKIENAAKPVFGKTLFDYAEIEDNYVPAYEDEELFCSEEELVICRYRYLKDFIPVKFWRVFSNH